MTYAKRLDALKEKGFEFTVEAKYNFKSEKMFNVKLPNGTVLTEQFEDITKAIKFCEKVNQ